MAAKRYFTSRPREARCHPWSIFRMPNRVSLAVLSAALCSAVLCCAATPVSAQGARGEGVGPGSTFPYANLFVATGGTLVIVDEVNGRLSKQGYFASSDDAIAVGGGLRIGYGRAVLGLEYSNADHGEEGNPNNGRSVQVTHNTGLLQAGYAFYAGRHLNFFAMLGAGVNQVTLLVGDRAGKRTLPAGVQPTFDEVLHAPGPSASLHGVNLTFEPAIGADWLVLRSVGDRVGITLGARAGSRSAPNRTQWTLDGDKVVGGPWLKPTGKYLRVTAGIGWR